ncbi:MAG: hypothetical protein JWN81_1352 [Solirubrobacterales bacterium]|nr:hypothetical protein [Solirubrobacterales bacterium]
MRRGRYDESALERELAEGEIEDVAAQRSSPSSRIVP